MGDSEITSDVPTAIATGPEDEELEAVPTSDALKSTPSLLQDAARRVGADWSRNPERAADQDMESELARVVGLIAEVREGESLSETTGEATALRLRILDQLRRQLLTESSRAENREASDDGELLALLRSLEAVRETLESDWARRFGLVLSGPHGVDLAAEIAHGLRSSCTSLLFVAEVLREGIYGELNEKQHQQIEILYGAAVSLTSSLSDITELSWRTEEPGEKELEAFSLHDIGTSVRHLLEPVAEAKGTDVTFDVGACADRLGHPRALRRILLNLVLDGVLGAEGGRVSVEMLDDEDQETVTFDIRATKSDRGEPGDGDRYRILRESLDDGQYSFSTKGLRLHVARQLVRALGGTLVHERVRESGAAHTTFTLELPPGEETTDS